MPQSVAGLTLLRAHLNLGAEFVKRLVDVPVSGRTTCDAYGGMPSVAYAHCSLSIGAGDSWAYAMAMLLPSIGDTPPDVTSPIRLPAVSVSSACERAGAPCDSLRMSGLYVDGRMQPCAHAAG